MLVNFSGTQFIISIDAVEKVVDRTRFDWASFHKSKLKRNRIKITRKPACYQIPGGKFIIHPALERQLREHPKVKENYNENPIY